MPATVIVQRPTTAAAAHGAITSCKAYTAASNRTPAPSTAARAATASSVAPRPNLLQLATHFYLGQPHLGTHDVLDVADNVSQDGGDGPVSV